MNINDLLISKDLTVYKLSKLSGIPSSTLEDIFSGKSNLMDCRTRVIVKLSNALNVSIEYLLSLDPVLYNPGYEENLPLFLQEDLKNVKNRKKMKSSLRDCYLDSLTSSINVCEVEQIISKEQANYLRKKYVWGDEL